MAKYSHAIVQEDGWTDWIWPEMAGYRMICCDCGLAHDIRFQAHKVVNKGTEGRPLDIEKYRVALQVSRNNRSTAQVRRHSSPAREDLLDEIEIAISEVDAAIDGNASREMAEAALEVIEVLGQRANETA